jgi:hypothetical protein
VAAFRAAPVYRGGGFRAARVYGGGYRYGYRHAYHRPFFHHRRHFHRRFYVAPAYTAIRLLWLPASLLPRDLDLLWAAKICKYPSLVALRYTDTRLVIGESENEKGARSGAFSRTAGHAA